MGSSKGQKEKKNKLWRIPFLEQVLDQNKVVFFEVVGFYQRPDWKFYAVVVLLLLLYLSIGFLHRLVPRTQKATLFIYKYKLVVFSLFCYNIYFTRYFIYYILTATDMKQLGLEINRNPKKKREREGKKERMKIKKMLKKNTQMQFQQSCIAS